MTAALDSCAAAAFRVYSSCTRAQTSLPAHQHSSAAELDGRCCAGAALLAEGRHRQGPDGAPDRRAAARRNHGHHPVRRAQGAPLGRPPQPAWPPSACLQRALWLRSSALPRWTACCLAASRLMPQKGPPGSRTDHSRRTLLWPRAGAHAACWQRAAALCMQDVRSPVCSSVGAQACAVQPCPWGILGSCRASLRPS